MALSDVQGQPRAIDALQAALRSGTVHHAYLFAGPAGVGKELAAVGLAQALICPESPGGLWHAAAALHAGGQGLPHPDVAWLMPEDERSVERGLARTLDFDHVPSREIRVEQMRRLQGGSRSAPLEAPRKVASCSPRRR